jgi:hypothetical protein
MYIWIQSATTPGYLPTYLPAFRLVPLWSGPVRAFQNHERWLTTPPPAVSPSFIHDLLSFLLLLQSESCHPKCRTQPNTTSSLAELFAMLLSYALASIMASLVLGVVAMPHHHGDHLAVRTLLPACTRYSCSFPSEETIRHCRRTCKGRPVLQGRGHVPKVDPYCGLNNANARETIWMLYRRGSERVRLPMWSRQ